MPKPYVIVQLDKPRKLRFGNTALFTIEEELGKPMTEFTRDNIRGIGVKGLTTMLWAALQHEDDAPSSPKETARLVDHPNAESLDVVWRKIGEAMQESMPKAKGETKNAS